MEPCRCLYIAPNVQAAQAIAATLSGLFDVLNGERPSLLDFNLPLALGVED